MHGREPRSTTRRVGRHRPGLLSRSALGRWALAATLLTNGVGCGETDASELETSQIRMNANAVVYAEGDAEVSVYLSDGFDDVIVSPGEQLLLYVDEDPPLVLAPASLGGYDAPLRTDARAIRVEYTRPDKVSAPNTIIALPEPLEFARPLAGRQVSHAEGDLELTVVNPMEGAKLRLFVADCGADFAGGVGSFDPVADEGTLTIPMARLVDGPPPAEGTCRTVEISREVVYPADPAFDPGSDAEGSRTEAFDVMVMP